MHQCGLPRQIKERIRHFVSKKALDVDAWAKKLVEQLVDIGLVKTFADLFLLEQEKLAQLERMGDKSAANLIDALTAARAVDLNRLVFALGIDHTGENAARILAGTYENLKDLMAAGVEDLSGIHGLGKRRPPPLPVFFQTRRIKGLWQTLKPPVSAFPIPVCKAGNKGPSLFR